VTAPTQGAANDDLETMRGNVKSRDAERSRRAILDAAERLFAARGFDAAGLADIGEAAGVSRGTPSYFFGSKEALYRAVLERMTADRTARLEPAFRPLVEWAEAKQPAEPLRAVLSGSIGDYLEFLRERPTYVDIVEREALDGGRRLEESEVESTVMEDAFGALRRRARAHGLRSFDVAEVIICVIGLGYMPVAHRETIMRRNGLSYDDPAFLRRRRRHIVDVLLHLIGDPDGK
jgi:AcrR family transcriptional regulator